MSTLRGWLCSIWKLHFSGGYTLEPVCADFTVWSAFDAMCQTQLSVVRWTRGRKKTTSVSLISRKKGQKCNTSNKWLTDAAMDMDANAYSLGKPREGTDNPLLISWIRRTNHCSYSIQTVSINKTHWVGFHSFCSFNLLMKYKDFSLNLNNGMISKNCMIL